MKIKSVAIENFRGYQQKTVVFFENLTAIVGRNDIGKSTIIEALDIFFHDGKGLIKLDKGDINKTGEKSGNTDITISVCFTELPLSVVIDSSNETTLADEYLLNKDGYLEVSKTFKNAATTATGMKVTIRAYHPTNPSCAGLLQKKQNDLISIAERLGVECEDKRKNACLRKAIWNKYNSSDDLNLDEIEIDVNSKDSDIKAIWGKLQSFLPYYSLFQSDRKNCDGDNEIQDPLKEAVKQIINDSDLQDKLDYVADKVRRRLQEVSDLTLAKIKEMNPEVADSLHPKVPLTQDLKWADVFKGLSITGDDDIPINKRGSGVKRLILLNFFRAEAERRQKETASQHIVYAIEEPETSQHKQHQLMLVNAIKALSANGGVQVIITTHSSDIVKQLEFKQLKIVYESNGIKAIQNVQKKCLPYPSLNEVNYLAFGDVSEEYHNELYGFLQARATEEDSDCCHEKAFEKWLASKGCQPNMQWIRMNKGNAQPAVRMTPETYIRNFIHHPENKQNRKYSNQELTESIDRMKEIAQSCIKKELEAD